MTKYFASRITPLLIATCLVAAGSLPMAFLEEGSDWLWTVYILAISQGIGISILLNVSTSLISDVIGDDNTSSAFVYGAYSFGDKISNGLLLAVLVGAFADDGYALRWILCLVPTISAAVAFICAYVGTALFADRITMVSKSSTIRDGPVKVTPSPRTDSNVGLVGNDRIN